MCFENMMLQIFDFQLFKFCSRFHWGNVICVSRNLQTLVIQIRLFNLIDLQKTKQSWIHRQSVSALRPHDLLDSESLHICKDTISEHRAVSARW